MCRIETTSRSHCCICKAKSETISIFLCVSSSLLDSWHMVTFLCFIAKCCVNPAADALTHIEKPTKQCYLKLLPLALQSFRVSAHLSAVCLVTFTLCFTSEQYRQQFHSNNPLYFPWALPAQQLTVRTVSKIVMNEVEHVGAEDLGVSIRSWSRA